MPRPTARSLVLATLLAAVALAGRLAGAETEIPLWTGDAPGSEGKTTAEVVVTSGNGERQVSSVHHPSITPFLPAGPGTGLAVLVIPGGGHRVLCIDHEGAFVGRWLASHGIAAFMLKHRLAREAGSTYTIAGNALDDTRRALRLIRAHATEWHIDPARLGAVGFSAGGELVALAAMHPAGADPAVADPIDRLDGRLAFQALIYPGGSADIVPAKDAPPMFMACSANDRQDIAEGLAEVYLKCKKVGASAELHIYASGGHGFGLRPGMTGELAGWPERMVEWLASQKLLETPAAK